MKPADSFEISDIPPYFEVLQAMGKKSAQSLVVREQASGPKREEIT
jgi:hypothetical protein